MPGRSCRHPRRAFARHHLVFFVVFAALVLAPALDGFAQGLTAQPTATEPDSPRDDGQLTTEPTVTPTPRVTEEPEIDDLQANPTAVPTEEPQPAPPSSLTINKGACDDSNFDPATAVGLQSFLDACQGVDGEFEFTVSNGGVFNVTAFTELGTFFTQLPTGPITITETIPGGWGDPAVFCWSNLAPTPSDTPFLGNGPTWDVQEGEDIECWWFNVSLASQTDGHDFFLDKYECPPAFDTAGDWQAFSLGCTTEMDAGFNVTDGQGPMFQETSGGHAEWPGIDFGDGGDLVITETVPEGYGEPVAFCTILPAAAADPEDFDTQRMESPGGVVTVAPVLGEQDHYHCAFFNIPEAGAPGDLTDPSSLEGGEEVEHEITLTKRTCPAGTDPDAGLGALLGLCAVTPGVEFTLEFGGGATSTTETDGSGVVSWGGIPYGPFEILETNHANYVLQSAHCQFEDLPGPGAWTYDITDGTYDGSFSENLDPEGDPIHLVCDWFNFEDGEGAMVTVVKFHCPLGVPEDTTIDQYIVICSELFPGVGFTLDHAGGSFPGTTGDDGLVVWTGVPAGEIEIQEDIPEGYKDPLAFCISFAGEQELESGQVTATGGNIPLTVPEEASATVCYVFNIQDPEQATSLTVNKWRCPIGFDEDANDPATECTTPMDGVTFTLGDMEATTGESGPGQAGFLDIPIGEHTLTEDVPPGIDHAFFRGCTVNGQWVLLALPIADFPTLDLEIEAGEHWTCDWYNVPAVESRVVINKRICPADTDFVLTDDNPIGTIIGNCPTPGEGIGFTLDHAGGSFPQPVDADGEIYWDGVPNGPITLTEQLPPGYLEPTWYCTSNPFDAAGVLTGAVYLGPIAAPGGVLNESLDETYGEIFACWVFNVPDPDATTVTVIKWLCPAGFDLETDNPVLECTEPMDNVNFTLNDLVAKTGDAGPGVAIFEDVPAGDDYELTEFLPGDTVYAFVTHCTLNGGPAVIPLTEEAPPVVTLDIDPGDHWVCHWYNVPNGENDIQIHKWLCPEGFDPNSTDQEYIDTCTEALDGITFQAMSDLGIAVLDTVGGQVGFGGFPAGMDVGIQEEIPDGYGNPYVICEYDDDQWHDVGAQSGFFEVYFAGSGETMECHVFNLHGEPPDLTILKWTCPVGYDLLAAGADPKADCTEATNGIAFELRFEGDATLQQTQTTGDVIDGGVLFDDLEPDIYNVAELVPDGIASAFILECTGHIMGVLQPYPLQFGPVLDDIDLDAGEHLTCHWFNVPGSEGGDLTLVKYTCTTEEFVSEVDCEIEEDGVSFDLSYWSGTWDLIGTETTDGFGRIHWTGLALGEYWFDEHDGDWCHIASEQLYEDGPWVVVPTGQETVVKIYNCDGTPGKPGDTPTKYPNTGIPPEATPAEPGRDGVVRVGFLDAFGGGFDLYGPFAGVVGLSMLIWRTVDNRARIARDRERTEERVWHEEAAAVYDRPAWMDKDASTSRTVRPAWMSAVRDDNPDSRPDWLSD